MTNNHNNILAFSASLREIVFSRQAAKYAKCFIRFSNDKFSLITSE